MKINIEFIKLSPNKKVSMDHNNMVFKITLGRKINIDNSKELWVFLKTAIEGGAKKILIDMRELDIIDSTGMSIFINAAKLIREKNGDIVFSTVSAEIKKIFNVVNLQEFINIYNLENEAIDFFRLIK